MNNDLKQVNKIQKKSHSRISLVITIIIFCISLAYSIFYFNYPWGTLLSGSMFGILSFVSPIVTSLCFLRILFFIQSPDRWYFLPSFLLTLPWIFLASLHFTFFSWSIVSVILEELKQIEKHFGFLISREVCPSPHISITGTPIIHIISIVILLGTLALFFKKISTKHLKVLFVIAIIIPILLYSLFWTQFLIHITNKTHYADGIVSCYVPSVTY